MNESSIIRLYHYLKNNYTKLYDSPIRYYYVYSSKNLHYFIQYSFNEFKIKAAHKENKNNFYMHKFSNCEELIALLRDHPFLETIFANIVKQLSYCSYLLKNRIRPSGTNIDDSFYIATRTYFNEYKNQYSDYLIRGENVISPNPNDQVISFSPRNIFINDESRIERVQLNVQNILTEQRVREIASQAFRERIDELIERQNRIAGDLRMEQNLRELRLRVEELGRRFNQREVQNNDE